jgi:hypothetical protein
LLDARGQPYSSLSAIARAITGTAWSGPRFFALKSAVEHDAVRKPGTARQSTQSQSSAGARRSRESPAMDQGRGARPKRR